MKILLRLLRFMASVICGLVVTGYLISFEYHILIALCLGFLGYYLSRGLLKEIFVIGRE